MGKISQNHKKKKMDLVGLSGQSNVNPTSNKLTHLSTLPFNFQTPFSFECE